MTAAGIEQRILASAEDGVGDEQEDTPGWDQYYGYGRVNAYRALTILTDPTDNPHHLSLYPNPSPGNVTIVIDQKLSMIASITVMNCTGQIVYTIDTPAERIIDQSLDLESIPAGIYIIRVSNATGYYQAKWVKW
jgi:hypothetical protein